MVQTNNASPFLAKSLATKVVLSKDLRSLSSGIIDDDEISEEAEGEYVRITLTGSQLVVTELPKGFRIVKEVWCLLLSVVSGIIDPDLHMHLA